MPSSLHSNLPFYSAYFDRVVPAMNKHMAQIFNTNANVDVLIESIISISNNAVAINGAALDQELRFLTAETPGTVVPVFRPDSIYPILPAGVSITTNGSGTLASTIINRWMTTNEKIGTGAEDSIRAIANQRLFTIYKFEPGKQQIVLHQNQGLVVRNITASILGSCSYLISFSTVIKV